MHTEITFNRIGWINLKTEWNEPFKAINCLEELVSIFEKCTGKKIPPDKIPRISFRKFTALLINGEHKKSLLGVASIKQMANKILGIEILRYEEFNGFLRFENIPVQNEESLELLEKEKNSRGLNLDRMHLRKMLKPLYLISIPKQEISNVEFSYPKLSQEILLYADPILYNQTYGLVKEIMSWDGSDEKDPVHERILNYTMGPIVAAYFSRGADPNEMDIDVELFPFIQKDPEFQKLSSQDQEKVCAKVRAFYDCQNKQEEIGAIFDQYFKDLPGKELKV